MTTSRILRLKNGDWSFGHNGTHHGIGTKDCPERLHHHHDAFCKPPTPFELMAAGIDPDKFEMRPR
jgi:hypothetical protein